jgi:hypothetical protein
LYGWTLNAGDLSVFDDRTSIEHTSEWIGRKLAYLRRISGPNGAEYGIVEAALSQLS